jgi:hypothetical protein
MRENAGVEASMAQTELSFLRTKRIPVWPELFQTDTLGKKERHIPKSVEARIDAKH